jgi:chromosome segregation ATPase
MKIKNIKEILAELSRELQRVDSVDADAQKKMQELNHRIERMDTPALTDIEFLQDRAKELESRFAALHPTLERIARELVDAISKMGI